MTQMIAAIDGSGTPVDFYVLTASAGMAAEYVTPYGYGIVRIDLRALESSQRVSGGGVSSSHYAVVITVTPTPFGEGKTTTAIGLAQRLNRLGQQAILALHQLAMGPTFGIKGGAEGSGDARILPVERMNLHLTGDFYAITAVHNLPLAMINDHLYHDDELSINEHTITWPRVLGINNYTLRHTVSGLGAKIDGVTRQASFDVTPASELMVIMSLVTDLSGLCRRLGRIVIGRSHSGEWISAEDLKAAGAMCVVPRDVLGPNPLRTGESTPVLIHAGSFGNITTGCSSIIADRIAVAGARDGGCTLTEAGFGSDMGLECFVDLKRVVSGMHPNVAVVVTTIRVLKAHSERHHLVSDKDLPEEMLQENVNDVRDGATSLFKHLQIVRGFGITPVVTVNVLPTGRSAKIEEVTRIADDAEARVVVCRPATRGGEDCPGLVGAAVGTCQEAGEPASDQSAYEPQDDLCTRISKLADLYGADGADCTPAASRLLEVYEQGGFGHLPAIIAKTPLPLSAEPGCKGVSIGWRLPVHKVRLAVGAGYVYAVCGSLSTMPGSPDRPAAGRIDVDLDTRQIVGLR